jgi:hypothetical protein
MRLSHQGSAMRIFQMSRDNVRVPAGAASNNGKGRPAQGRGAGCRSIRREYLTAFTARLCECGWGLSSRQRDENLSDVT